MAEQIERILTRMQHGIRVLCADTDIVGDECDLSGVELEQPLMLLHCLVVPSATFRIGPSAIPLREEVRLTCFIGVSPDDPCQMTAMDLMGALTAGEIVLLSNVTVVGDVELGGDDGQTVAIKGGLVCEDCRFSDRVALSGVDFDCPVRLRNIDWGDGLSLSNVAFSRLAGFA